MTCNLILPIIFQSIIIAAHIYPKKAIIELIKHHLKISSSWALGSIIAINYA